MIAWGREEEERVARARAGGGGRVGCDDGKVAACHSRMGKSAKAGGAGPGWNIGSGAPAGKALGGGPAGPAAGATGMGGPPG